MSKLYLDDLGEVDGFDWADDEQQVVVPMRILREAAAAKAAVPVSGDTGELL